GRVVAGRGAVRQHLLDHDIAFEVAALLPAVFLRPGHADPALGADLAGKGGGIVVAAALRAERAGVDLLPQESANLLAELDAFGRQIDRVELETGAHRCLTIPRSGRATARRRRCWRPCCRCGWPNRFRCRIPRATTTAGASSGGACARR